MAFSSSSCSFFTSPNFTVNRQPISANFATAERTASFSTRSQRITNQSSLYDVLGIQIGADTLEIKAAYRRLARVLHPDVGNCDSSADEFMKVHSAYATLSDPGKRADYDRSLFVRQKMSVRSSSLSSSPAGFSGYSGRRWETDQCW
ncbi:putative DnaJ domain, Chaperone J-domain superfamily [Helianthus debilis subsp. tardiflorus]